MSEAAYGTAKAQHWIVEEGDDESRLKALKERIDNTPGYGSPQQLVLMKKAQALQNHLRHKGKGLDFKVQLRSILLAREEDAQTGDVLPESVRERFTHGG